MGNRCFDQSVSSPARGSFRHQKHDRNNMEDSNLPTTLRELLAAPRQHASDFRVKLKTPAA
jgi:hypothetical protein